MNLDNDNLDAEIKVAYRCTYKGMNQYGYTDVILEPHGAGLDMNTHKDVSSADTKFNTIIFTIPKNSTHSKTADLFFPGNVYELKISLVERVDTP